MSHIDELLTTFRAPLGQPSQAMADAAAARAVHGPPPDSTIRRPAPGRLVAWSAIGLTALTATVAAVYLATRTHHGPTPLPAAPTTGWGLVGNIQVIPARTGVDRGALTQQATESLKKRWAAKGIEGVTLRAAAPGVISFVAPNALRRSQIADLLGTTDGRVYDLTKAGIVTSNPREVIDWLTKQPVSGAGRRWSLVPDLGGAGGISFGPGISSTDAVPNDGSLQATDVAVGPAEYRVLRLAPQPGGFGSPEMPGRYAVVRDTDAVIGADAITGTPRRGRDVLLTTTAAGAERIHSLLETQTSEPSSLVYVEINDGYSTTFSDLEGTATPNTFRLPQPFVPSTNFPDHAVAADYRVTATKRYGDVPSVAGKKPLVLPRLIAPQGGTSGSFQPGEVRKVLTMRYRGVWDILVARTTGQQDIFWIARRGASLAQAPWPCDPPIGSAIRTCFHGPANWRDQGSPGFVVGRLAAGQSVRIRESGSATPSALPIATTGGWWLAVEGQRKVKEVIAFDAYGHQIGSASAR